MHFLNKISFCRHYNLKGRVKGQIALETAFVFSMLIFLAFSIINMAILFHSKTIATYAAFMAGRSYQVMGDQTAAETFLESAKSGGADKFLDQEQTLAAIRTAEDIFTCALPWIAVPQGDALADIDDREIERKPELRCMEGKRKYKSMNVGSGKNRSLDFLPFKEDGSSAFGTPKLGEVTGGFKEAGRDPLRYGILHLTYRTPLLFNPYNLFAVNEKSRTVRDGVYVPILLNPGLESGLKNKPTGQNQEEDDQ